MWRRRDRTDVGRRLRPDQQDGARGVIYHEPDRLAQALGAEPGPVAVPRHDEQIRVGRRGHHGPFGLTVNFEPFAPVPEPAGGSLEQLGS
jgi:hypothetical protein